MKLFAIALAALLLTTACAHHQTIQPPTHTRSYYWGLFGENPACQTHDPIDLDAVLGCHSVRSL